MTHVVHDLLKQYVKEIKKIYGLSLQKIILYGSYARGDYVQDSDIDIMILVNMSDEEIFRKRHELSDITFDYNFNHWIGAYPFYNNVQKEGVELYAA